MNKNTQEKSLIKVNENSIIYKIKQFFKNLFKRKNIENTTQIKEENINNNTNVENSSSNDFFKRIQTIDDENTLLLKLQQQYENGQIQEENLTPKQVNDLCNLYEKQIEELKGKIANVKSKIMEYKN